MFFYIVFTPISTTPGLISTGNMRKCHQIDVYIYQCDVFEMTNFTIKSCSISFLGFELDFFLLFSL